MSDSAPNQKTEFHWPSLFQAILSAVAALISWGLALLMLFGAVQELLVPSSDIYAISSFFSLVMASFLIGGLFAFSLFFSLMRLIGVPVNMGNWWRRLRAIFHPKILLVLYPLILLVGFFANQNELARNLALPVLNILSMVIPVIVLLWLALRGLPKGSRQRGWGALSLGLVIGPTVVLFLEIFVLILMVVVLAISAENDPALMQAFSNFDIWALEADNPYLVDQAVGELLNTPQFLIAILLVLAGFVPLIEELFKPISVWVLMGRKLRPVDGWVIGAMSGAGFALFESLGQATISENWLIGVVGRLGASIPHVFTTALMGYTLALARSQKKYGRVPAAFVGVVAIHAAWNASSVLMAAASYASEETWLKPSWANGFLVLVCVLGAAMVFAMVRINRKLRNDNHQAAADEAQPVVSLSQNSEQDPKETFLDGTDYNAD